MIADSDMTKNESIVICFKHCFGEPSSPMLILCVFPVLSFGEMKLLGKITQVFRCLLRLVTLPFINFPQPCCFCQAPLVIVTLIFS